MRNLKEELHNEVVELKEKLSKLNAFIQSYTFSGLSMGNRAALVMQQKAMTKYIAALNWRIELMEVTE